MKSKKDARLFLESLKEDGIEEIYLPPNRHSVANPVKEAPVSRKTANPSKEMKQSESVKDQLVELRNETLKCFKCAELCHTRKNVVFGSGSTRAKLMFVGEAPGADEDEQGLPFVGRAGQLLTKIIESIGLQREDVFIANVLKCRPPQNRRPKPEEVVNCEPFLIQQIKLIKPVMLCALGTSAAQTLLKTETPISQLRGKFYDYHGSRLLCTFHPAYLLRNPSEKRSVWEDMKKIKKELDEMP
jgi:uracil-DNA glycosylase